MERSSLANKQINYSEDSFCSCNMMPWPFAKLLILVISFFPVMCKKIWSKVNCRPVLLKICSIILACQEPAHKIPPMTSSRGEDLTSKAPQGFRKAALALTLKMISVFLMLAIFDCSLISVTQVDSLPRSLSKQNQLRTLISMSPGQWYPIRLSRMEGVFQLRLLCWHSSLLGKCVLMHLTVHSTLIINSIKNLITQKALIGTEPFRR